MQHFQVVPEEDLSMKKILMIEHAFKEIEIEYYTQQHLEG